MRNGPFEIERRYLIRRPDELWLDGAAERSEIVQTYLTGDDGATERVRMRRNGESTAYTHTIKHRVNDLRSVEIETEIEADEYAELLKRADPRRAAICKTRYCLTYCGQTFEIDLYPFWKDQALMEIELTDEGQAVSLPPGIELLREVSGDRRYSNASLARELAKRSQGPLIGKEE